MAEHQPGMPDRPNARSVFERVRELRFPIGQYVVTGGSMEAHGIRPARDLDCLVTHDFFEELLRQGWDFTPLRPGDTGRDGTKRKLGRDDVQINSEYSWQDKYYADTEYMISSADVIEGIPFASLHEIMQWKAASGRPKDLEDIELIKNYLKQ